ncbi:hypothetical protein AAZX31_04G210900 [Glycine max]|uniref:Uncharacterized protein n=2 Tax=Glycine subgen. Soja TaxID=1462606 RepID=C6SVK6_SOYBN|nr:unknown [Glycine max]KAG5036060.1 hypothetical protein JHK87_010970 [Glycine soja]KAG5050308.1 hypothetical protein JHK85_011411 [Glycine max]KAG5067363.1 hypothetical protein JHK86_011094 [Glycine max]KAH1112763.1 hypothetical protein GYH30_010825 [Glycine max]
MAKWISFAALFAILLLLISPELASAAQPSLILQLGRKLFQCGSAAVPVRGNTPSNGRS